ncbi:hypothetical protein MTR_1g019160 [Medicago truncatula]|uniref:Uncharacterized protein n=1 Tax=Medicago truncatula TaxID=3880 RepID=G7I2E3_MEDTR|nr:hypothetical protein MTR_1g019160 [Medicago truncatula]
MDAPANRAKGNKISMNAFIRQSARRSAKLRKVDVDIFQYFQGVGAKDYEYRYRENRDMHADIFSLLKGSQYTAVRNTRF